MSAPPLSDIRVLDLTRLLPGGFCSLLLADFGADVIKVEDTGAGDYVRWAPPYYGDEDQQPLGTRSALYLSLNRGKRSIRVDLKSDDGRAAFLRLAGDCDVVLESFRPGVLDRLGCGYEALREVNPGIVYCAITGYGQDGPNTQRAGHDTNYLALNGLLGLTGAADGPPVQAGGQPWQRHRKFWAGNRAGVDRLEPVGAAGTETQAQLVPDAHEAQPQAPPAGHGCRLDLGDPVAIKAAASERCHDPVTLEGRVERGRQMLQAAAAATPEIRAQGIAPRRGRETGQRLGTPAFGGTSREPHSPALAGQGTRQVDAVRADLGDAVAGGAQPGHRHLELPVHGCSGTSRR